MTDRVFWSGPPHTHHATLSDAADCPECLAFAVDFLADAPHAYMLRFPPHHGDPQALSLVRDWQPVAEDASYAAWATGCNLPRAVLIEEIPVGVAIESGVEMFRLHHGAQADEAFRAILALIPSAGRSMR